MKSQLHCLAVALLAATTTASFAQYVKGNEAVSIAQGGARNVATPPIEGALLGKPCPISEPGCRGGALRMVETTQGLMQCTEVYARPTTCQASTYGSEKRPRIWVVKTGSEWKQCSYPDISKGCVSIKALPSPVVQ